MAFYKGWITQFNAYNTNIKLSMTANIITQIGIGIFIVIYNFYVRELGYSESVNGQIISMASLATAIVLVPAGIIGDKFGRKRVIFSGILVSGTLLIMRALAAEETMLVYLAFAAGLSGAFLQVSGIPWLAENSDPSQRVNLFSLHFALMTAASVVGNLLGGILTDFFGLFFSNLESLRITLLIGAVIYLGGAVPAFKFRTPANRVAKPKTDETAKKKAFNWSGFKIIALFAVAQMLIGFGAGLVIPYLNLYFAGRFSASTSTTGFIISLGQAATAFAMIIGPKVVKRVGEVRAVVILQLLSLPFLLLTAYTQNLWLAAIGFLFRQALMNAGNPIQSSLIMSRVDDSMKGLANSINQTVFNLGWAFMGPVSTGIVVKYGNYWGYAYVFTITASLYLIGSVYFYLVFGRKVLRNRASQVPKAAGM
ncbi:MFS transporter [Neobacillus piezotolerans]|uniref:MFS transporter n=1 Tax=Neobacillus piezotolerans TaxID=2259171 RepID=A0A3D8GR37_9BACI|nr:MFS transporter [Neobacillus piezotolerans]RDU36954.1 MFS transporter [Neobacillus piezotolerans]